MMEDLMDLATPEFVILRYLDEISVDDDDSEFCAVWLKGNITVILALRNLNLFGNTLVAKIVMFNVQTTYLHNAGKTSVSPLSLSAL